MPDGEIWVFQRLVTSNSLCGIKVEHLGEQVKSEWVCVWEQLRERYSGPDGQRPDIVLSLWFFQLNKNFGDRGGRLTLGEPTRRRVSSEGVPR